MNDEPLLTLKDAPQSLSPDPFESFADASKDRFKLWLRVGLEGFYTEKKGRWAFTPFELLVGRDIDLSLDLRDIYQRFQARQQANWRQAVAEVLAELPTSSEFLPVLECLLDLARLMPAFEVLKVLPTKIGEGPFGLMRTRTGQPVFDKVLLTAVELAANTEDARSCLHQLTVSTLFEPAYAGAAFVALCRVEPDKWPAHLTRMRQHLNAMVQRYKLDDEACRRFARDLVDAVGADRLVARLDELYLDPMLRDTGSSDLWLWQALFEGQDAPLRIAAATSVEHQGEKPRPAFVTRREEPTAVIQLRPEIQNAPIRMPPVYTTPAGPLFEMYGMAAHTAIRAGRLAMDQHNRIKTYFFAKFGISLT